MATNKIQTGLRLNESTYNKAKVLSDKEKRSLNNLIEYVLEAYIKDYEAKNGEIEPYEDE